MSKDESRKIVAMHVALKASMTSVMALPQVTQDNSRPHLPGGVLPSNGLMGMCCWMGSHFYDWIDYNGVAFLIELPEWGGIFSGIGG